MNTLITTHEVISQFELRKVLKYWGFKDEKHVYFMLAPQWIKFNPAHVYSSVLKMQQEQMAKNQKDLIKKGKMNELGIKEEDRDGQDEEAKSDMSALGPKMSEDHQTNPDQQNLFRVQKILARNSNLIKEPQLYSKDIEI